MGCVKGWANVLIWVRLFFLKKQKCKLKIKIKRLAQPSEHVAPPEFIGYFRIFKILMMV